MIRGIFAKCSARSNFDEFDQAGSSNSLSGKVFQNAQDCA